MSDQFDLFKKPKEKEIYLLAGWRQWVDGGAISSGLPRYLRKKLKAKKIAELKSDGYYLFQLPGTQDMMRPIVRHVEGLPQALQTRANKFYYTVVDGKGLVFFTGDEPHLDVERYTRAFLDVVHALGVKRSVIYGGIYGEVPYDKERFVTSIFSLKEMRAEVNELAVNMSSYQGGASIGSYVVKRGGERKMEIVGLYTFSPIFHFVGMDRMSETIHIENDYMAWLGVMRRTLHMLNIEIDLSELERKSDRMLEKVHAKLEELDKNNPELGVAEFVKRLSEDFEEPDFAPLEDVWQEELRRIGDKFDPLEGDAGGQ